MSAVWTRQPDQVFLGVGDDMALAALDLLAGVVAPETGNIGGLCRLAVDDAGAGARLATAGNAGRRY
jgi:hypothetical protein